MKLRLIVMISFLCASVTGWAFDMPTFDFFTPTDKDLSLWYLANLFGSDLVPSQGSIISPYMQLLALLFGVFNQVVLVVGMLIVMYNVIAGVVGSAAEGKPLGEKWNVLWMPIRIVVGIAMLVPKAGTGYCLAQYIIMWLILNGVGAADTLWTDMVKYFDEGGAIAVNVTETPATIFSYDNMNYTYSTQSHQTFDTGHGKSFDTKLSLLRSMVCVEAFNNDPQAVENAGGKRREPYVVLADQPDAQADIYYLIMFGDRSKFDRKAPINEARRGSECGYVRYHIAGVKQSDAAVQEDMTKANVYILGLYHVATKLRKLADYIVTQPISEDPTQFEKYYPDAQQAMEFYIRYIVGYQNILKPQGGAKHFSLEPYARYGWLLAGNYYAVLANFRAKNERLAQIFVLPEANKLFYTDVVNSEDPHQHYERADQFYQQYLSLNPPAMYSVPGSQYSVEQEGNKLPTHAHSPITREKVEELRERVQRTTGGGELGSAAVKRVDEFIGYLSGKGGDASPGLTSGLSSQNPINRAAQYGQSLMEGAIVLVTTGTLAMFAFSLSTSLSSWSLGFYNVPKMLAFVLGPLLIALGGFMYANGAVLGVMIPIIPYLTFLTGVIGWMLQCVESVAAAPLVAIGLIFPETKSEVWGRAQPALMLILNLFLRPSLMIIGLAGAMIMGWVVIELLNIGFLTIIGGTFRVENSFGFVAILMAYTAAFTFVITEAYSLINVVPNKVLSWIGDQSMGVKGAKEAIAGAKHGVEAAGAAVAGGYAVSEKADMYRAQSSMEQFEEQQLDDELSAGMIGVEAKDKEKAKADWIGKLDPHKRAIYDRGQRRKAGGGEMGDDVITSLKK